jgi:hypothetical protein
MNQQWERIKANPERLAAFRTYQSEYRRERYARDPDFRAREIERACRYQATHGCTKTRRRTRERGKE